MVRRRGASLWTFWQVPIQWFRTDQTDWVGMRTANTLPYWIALAAGLGLFLEMAVLRWHSALFPLLGLFKNVSLLSALLGLGIGYSVGKRRPIRLGFVILFLALQLAFFGLVKFAGWHHLLANPVSEITSMGLDPALGWGSWFGAVGFCAAVFVLNALTFLPLGQVVSGLMSRTPTLRAYGFYLAGILGGVLAFSALSYLWMPPEVWFAVAFAGLIAMMGASAAVSPAIVSCALLFAIFCSFEPRPLRKNVYSPYQALTVRPVSDDSRVVVSVNQLYSQRILDLSRAQSLRSPSAQLSSMSFDMPFQLTATPENILILGSGTGNEVAAALRRGAAHVDAVEVDPALAAIGAELHPEKPYQDQRVSTHFTDARAFLRQDGKSYNLILYGNVDSSAMASFAYTLEAFEEARGRLKDGGMLAIGFTRVSEETGQRLFQMLKQAFDGQDPTVLQPGYDGGVLFLAGEGTRQIASSSLPLPNLASRYSGGGVSDLATDDWPFFAMPQRQYPFNYAAMLAILAALSIVMVRSFVPRERRAGVTVSSWLFFFLGAGFFLVQARAMSDLALAYGTTWMVPVAALCCVVLVAGLSNLVAAYLPSIPKMTVFAGVAASLLFVWWVQGGQTNFEVETTLTVLMAVVPLLFGGILFSSALRDHAGVGGAMSATALGFVCGGFLEYHVLVSGVRSLTLYGLGFYACAFAAYLWQRRSSKRAHKPVGKVPLRKVATGR